MVSQTRELRLGLLAIACASLGAAGCSALSPYDTARARPPGAPTGPAPPQPQPGPAPAQLPSRSPDAAPATRAELPPPSGPPQRAPATSSASAALLERGRGERDAGDYASAAASLERALRIAPNDPALWIELAEIKLAAGDPAQAEMMARKALTLAGNDRSIAQRADSLMRR